MTKAEIIKGLVACKDCGQVLNLPELPDNSRAQCNRCGAELLRAGADTIDRTLALSFASLILFTIANTYPFIGLRIEGIIQETNLITGIFMLYSQGMVGLSFLVMLSIVIIPMIQIIGMIHICLPLKFGRMPWKGARLFRMLKHIQPWGMLEIYMVGILVAMIKLAKMATVVPGIASVAFMFLIILLTAAISGLNPHDIWKRIPIKTGGQPAGKGHTLVSGCHCCHLVCRVPDDEGHHHCPRCQSSLHFRKINSMSRTWALVAAAIIFYFPANIFPVTISNTMGHEQADTILSGVIYFMMSGSWHIALIIFVASVLVPLLKLVILIFLLISVQKKSRWKPRDRTRLYRLTEAVGRWSMIDVFVVTILIALVQLGPIANIVAGPGVIYFSAVVVITMFAAECFDPRLIWDKME